LTRSAALTSAFEGGAKKRRSELALSEAEGINPEPVERVDKRVDYIRFFC